MCHDHCTVNNVNKQSGHLESTGIGAMACIHGTFVPNSVVDFQRGEVYVPNFLYPSACWSKLRLKKSEKHGLFDI
jgi:hypothetical protein